MSVPAKVARAQRLKDRSDIKRKSYEYRIRSIHAVALRSIDNATVVPQLLVMMEQLDEIWAAFRLEDETVLHQLLELDLSSEYSAALSNEMFEFISATKAIVNRLIEYGHEQTIVSEHGGSRASLNLNVEIEPPQPGVRAHADANGPAVSPGDVQSHAAGSLLSNGVNIIKPTRLPEIPLPTFYGDIFKWTSFRDRFVAMVDRRASISDIEKFYYLVGCCKGDALDAIRGIPVSDNNYKLAWSTLTERFDKPRLVAFSLVDNLLNAPKASTESLVELSKFLVIFDEGVSVLESMNLPNLGDFVKENRLRKARQTKMYVAVFVCFAVRAVHLELVSDLSTEAFVAALNRFVARRGLPSDIYSDCGTNFIGADNQLRTIVNDPGSRDQLSSTVHCAWHFNPPGAPHFGGLWEAAVRSTKSLLVRIMGEHVFTLEEFNTVLCRVEAILNSRPLTPLSSDPADLSCLTPGHFLIGRPLLSVPEVQIPAKTRPLVNRWKLINQCVQSFWRRWRNEYLQTLQTRSRWLTDAPNIAVDHLVVIKDSQTPPLKWRMGRVTEVLPGADQVVRVVRLKTATGTTYVTSAPPF